MINALENNIEKSDEFSDFVDIYSLGVNELGTLFEVMNNFDLIEEFCTYKIQDESDKNYMLLKDELEKRKKNWIVNLSKTAKNDFQFYRTLNNRGIEPSDGRLSSLRGAIMSVHGYHSLKAGTMEIELSDGSKNKMGYSEKLGHCKPSRIRKFAKKSYFNGEEIYNEILSGS